MSDTDKIFNRGTIEEFTPWHEATMVAEGIPHDNVTAYSMAVHHPNNTDDYIWPFGAYPIEGKDQLSMEDIQALGWYPPRD